MSDWRQDFDAWWLEHKNTFSTTCHRGIALAGFQAGMLAVKHAYDTAWDVGCAGLPRLSKRDNKIAKLLTEVVATLLLDSEDDEADEDSQPGESEVT